MHCSQHHDLFTHFNITHEIYYYCEMLFTIDHLMPFIQLNDSEGNPELFTPPLSLDSRNYLNMNAKLCLVKQVSEIHLVKKHAQM